LVDFKKSPFGGGGQTSPKIILETVKISSLSKGGLLENFDTSASLSINKNPIIGFAGFLILNCDFAKSIKDYDLCGNFNLTKRKGIAEAGGTTPNRAIGTSPYQPE
jgi:hypothetical protein